jgi:hypothetical protein
MEKEEYRKEQVKQYWLKHDVKIKEYQKQYRLKNKDKFKEYKNNYDRQRRNTDPKFKLVRNLRAYLYQLLGSGRSRKTLDVLGCSPEEFKRHLESQFQYWMTWENMAGRKVPGPNMVWDVDHIIPTSSAQTEEDVYRLFHYTNLRPLCAHYNRFIKRSTY